MNTLRMSVAAVLAMATTTFGATIGGYAAQNGGTTGGAGGTVAYASTGTEIHEALCARTSTSAPIIIYVQGTITLDTTTKVTGKGCDIADYDRIELKGVSNVSIIGYGTGALFDQIGIHIRGSSNIILQNLHIRNVKKSNGATSNGGDAIGMESTVSNVWVDHCTLEASGGESDGYDGLCDMKSGTKYVTVSYCIYMNSGRGGLVGSSDTDDDNGPVTYHHNYYYNMDSRMPLLRFATAHSYNNYFYIINESAMNPRIGGKIKAENNYFKQAENPIGTFYTDDMGYWDVSGNVFDDCTWTDDDHPAGPNPVSTTSISIPYTYTLDAASCVPAIVVAAAGANTGLKVSSGSCGTTTSSTTTTPTPTTASKTTPTPTTASKTTPTPTTASKTTPTPTTASKTTPTPTTATKTTPTPTTASKTTPTPTTSSSSSSTNNLSLLDIADASGSGKASGTTYGNAHDGDYTTYWQPDASTGYIEMKWSSTETVAKVVISELSGYSGNIKSWQLSNADTGSVLASGTSGVTSAITFTATKLEKLLFTILTSSGTPRIAEFETYASSAATSTPAPTPKPVTPTPTTKSSTPAPTPKPATTTSCSTVVSEWGACLGNTACCASGSKCYEANEWYAQCRPSCDVSGWTCKVLG